MTAYDAQGRGQSEPVAGLLGGEEGVENLLDRLGGHPDSVVRDLDEAIGRLLGTGRVERHLEAVGVPAGDARGDLDPAAAVPDRVGRIGHQVHDDLPDL